MPYECPIRAELFAIGTELQPPPSRASARHESIHCLCIVTHGLSDTLQRFTDIKSGELIAWLTHAGRAGRALVVLQTSDTLEFYTTDYERRFVLRPVLEVMAEKVVQEPALKTARTLEMRGIAAARHLLSYVLVQASSPEPCDAVDLQIQSAAARSAAAAALGPILRPLFRAAVLAGRRVRRETLFNDPTINPEIRNMEFMAAGRIIEEELAIWQAQETEFERHNDERARNNRRQTGTFETLEPSSEVRLRIGAATGSEPVPERRSSG
jgi:hypothetical protein